jgi:hypothetical protein
MLLSFPKMNRSVLIALLILIAFGSTGMFGQNLRVASSRAASAPMAPHVGFSGYHARRSLIGLTGPPLHSGARRQFYGRNAFYGGFPYGISDYEDSYGPEVVVQDSAPAAAVPAPISPMQPASGGVLLELQGDHWVKVSSFTMAPSSNATQVSQGQATRQASVPAKELPPTVIVYRDGRSEELSGYSIIGPAIFAKSDYWSSGAWTRKILLADIDIPATTKQNQARGVKFNLPSGPNEVVLRP